MANTYLKGLLSDREEIKLVAHQHWTVLVWNILPESLLIVGILFLVSFTWAELLPKPSVALAYLLLLLPAISLVRDVLIWSNHEYVVTSRRVIQLLGVLNKNVTDSSLEKVNDVKMSQSLFGRLLGFGDIEILTASEMGVNRFTRIGDPVRFKTAMLNAKGALHPDDSNPGRPGPDLLAQLKQLHDQGVLTDAEYEQKKAALKQ